MSGEGEGESAKVPWLGERGQCPVCGRRDVLLNRKQKERVLGLHLDRRDPPGLRHQCSGSWGPPAPKAEPYVW